LERKLRRCPTGETTLSKSPRSGGWPKCSRHKALERKDARLKCLVADPSLEKRVLKDVAEANL
jgi:hypothetical protein